jgi:hypothetical protein
VISIHGSEKDARTIEQGLTPGHINVNYLQDEKTETRNDTSATKSKEVPISKLEIEP